MVTAMLDEKYELDKTQLMERMKARNIDCRPFFYPLSTIPAYRHCEEASRARKRNIISYQIHRNAINLPSGLNLTEKLVQRICNELKSAIV
jgi:perosamine synthetase